MINYYNTKHLITEKEQFCIDYMINHFANKWLNCVIYEKCLRKFHISTMRFEEHVKVEFKAGYVKILRQEEVGFVKSMSWYLGEKKLSK